jgi:hypothetical protein
VILKVIPKPTESILDYYARVQGLVDAALEFFGVDKEDRTPSNAARLLEPLGLEFEVHIAVLPEGMTEAELVEWVTRPIQALCLEEGSSLLVGTFRELMIATGVDLADEG